MTAPAPAGCVLAREPVDPLAASRGLRSRRLELSEASVHAVEAGAGPTVLLLHGMPAFWYSYRHQLEPLANAGFRAVAIDLPGYNLSSKPRGVAAYDDGRMLARMTEVIASIGGSPVHLVGHDRGGWLAWMLAMHRPELLRSVTVIAVPHPRRMRENLYRWDQLRRSWYAYFLQLPRLPELLFRARSYALVRRVVAANRRLRAIDAEEVDAYVRAAAQPGALTSMFGYYRANARAVLRRDPLWWAPRLPAVKAPTLVLWPTHDRYQSPALAAPDVADVPDARLFHLEGGHWLHEDNPDAVNTKLIAFLRTSERAIARGLASGTSRAGDSYVPSHP